MARILVTGGAGFVGSHLVDQLVKEGHSVLALDDLSTGSRENLAHLDGKRGFSFLEHDVVDPWPDLDVDFIYNLACPGSPPGYEVDPVKTTMTSVLGVYNGLRLAERRRARFLQASSSEVYGDPLVHPQPESYAGHVSPVGRRACYDEGKRCAESLCMDFHRASKLDTRLVRIFNTYGPRMAFDDGRVVSNFIVQALTRRPLTLYGEGDQTRSFCYVSDLVRGMTRLMEHPTETRPVNLGNPEELTMLELAHEVLALVDREGGSITHRPLPVDDPRQRRPDIRRAVEVLGFRPMVSLRRGLALTVADFRRRLEILEEVEVEALDAADAL